MNKKQNKTNEQMNKKKDTVERKNRTKRILKHIKKHEIKNNALEEMKNAGKKVT